MNEKTRRCSKRVSDFIAAGDARPADLASPAGPAGPSPYSLPDTESPLRIAAPLPLFKERHELDVAGRIDFLLVRYDVDRQLQAAQMISDALDELRDGIPAPVSIAPPPGTVEDGIPLEAHARQRQSGRVGHNRIGREHVERKDA